METLRFLMATTFYPPYHLGGDAVHVQYLAEALVARGHEVHVEFAPAAYRLKRKSVPPSSSSKGSDVHVHPIPSPLGRVQPLAAHLIGRSRGVTRFHDRLQTQIRPDVVHLHNISLLGLGVLRRAHGAKMLYTVHDYWARCPRSDLRKYGGDSCDRPTCTSCSFISRRPPQVWRYGKGWRGLPGLDCAIAPSRFMARAIGPSLACPVVHIPNFTPDLNPSASPSKPEDYFLFVGVLERHKGVLEVAEAALRPGRWRVSIVGSGSLSRRLPEFQRDGARLDAEGWVSSERLQRLYRRAKGLLVPSLWDENAPLAAIEALSWGTPLLVSQRGGVQELVYEGSAGRFLGPDGVGPAIERFEEEGLHHALRSGARRAYDIHHRPERYIERYLALIRRIGGNASSNLVEAHEAAPDVVPLLAASSRPARDMP